MDDCGQKFEFPNSLWFFLSLKTFHVLDFFQIRNLRKISKEYLNNVHQKYYWNKKIQLKIGSSTLTKCVKVYFRLNELCVGYGCEVVRWREIKIRTPFIKNLLDCVSKCPLHTTYIHIYVSVFRCRLIYYRIDRRE